MFINNFIPPSCFLYVCRRVFLSEHDWIHYHTCQVLRFGRSHYGFLDKLKTTGVVGKDYSFMLVWRCNFFGNHLITFGLFLDEVMGLSQYCWPTNIVRLCFWRSESMPLTNNHRSPLFLELRISAGREQLVNYPRAVGMLSATGI